jgi:hypothetical protein
MACEKLWILGDGAKPIRLVRSSDGIYREPMNPKMIFIPKRHTLDLSTVNRAEPICPYHFKGKTPHFLMLGVAIGVFIGGIFNMEPIISAIVFLTFAVTTLLFHSNATSEYVLVRLQGQSALKFIIVAQEDLLELKERYSQIYEDNECDSPDDLTEKEQRIVRTQRYAFVTISSSITLFAMIRPMLDTFKVNTVTLESVMTWVVFLVALTMAYTGAIRVTISYISEKKALSRES